MVPTEMLPLVMLTIDKVREGRTLTAACRLSGIQVATFRRHVSNSKELQDLFATAEQESADMMADFLAEPFNHEIYGETDVAKAALTSRNVQWLLQRRAPQKYGDKSSIEVTHRADDTLIAAMEAGRQRALALKAPATEIIEAEFSEPMDPETRALIYG